MSEDYANEEFGVPALRDGIAQDPNNHNGPKPGDSSGDKDALGGLNSAEVEAGVGYDQVDHDKEPGADQDEDRAVKAKDEPETPERPANRAGRSVADKKETR